MITQPNHVCVLVWPDGPAPIRACYPYPLFLPVGHRRSLNQQRMVVVCGDLGGVESVARFNSVPPDRGVDPASNTAGMNKSVLLVRKKPLRGGRRQRPVVSCPAGQRQTG